MDRVRDEPVDVRARPALEADGIARQDRQADDLGRKVALMGDADELIRRARGRRRSRLPMGGATRSARVGRAAGRDGTRRAGQPDGLRRLDRGPGGLAIREPGRVDRGVLRPFDRQRLLREDRVHRALRLAGPAVDALVGIDEQLAVDAHFVVDAVDRAHRDARDIKDIDARLGDDVGHSRILLVGLGRSRMRARQAR